MTKPYQAIDDVAYHECEGCKSLFADPNFLNDMDSGKGLSYASTYWESELYSARERSYGQSINRIAETLFYARIPVNNFIDIGTGPGFLLDAISQLIPENRDIFHGSELFPPAPNQRSQHPNYWVGHIRDMQVSFDAGVCIEVIEHLTPKMLDDLASQLAERSNDGAIYYFGSGQPEYVKNEDPAYLDPKGRGHIVSYSVSGLANIFNRHGFNVIPLPGRGWAFLCEYGPIQIHGTEDLLKRLWTPNIRNVETFFKSDFGFFLKTCGLESARCYLEHSTAIERTNWAISLKKLLNGG